MRRVYSYIQTRLCIVGREVRGLHRFSAYIAIPLGNPPLDISLRPWARTDVHVRRARGGDVVDCGRGKGECWARVLYISRGLSNVNGGAANTEIPPVSRMNGQIACFKWWVGSNAIDLRIARARARFYISSTRCAARSLSSKLCFSSRARSMLACLCPCPMLCYLMVYI